MKTTTKATADGYCRFAFTGTSSSASTAAPGDYVDVRQARNAPGT